MLLQCHSSPVLHIGSTEHVQAESRILHIRQIEMNQKTRTTERRDN